MAQPLPPPPPTGATLDRWLSLLWKKTSGALQTLWSQIDTTGSNTPAGNISATTIQGAINELDTEKLAKTGDTAATLTITSADINGGTVDATTVGATTPAAGTFTTLTISGDVALSKTVTVAGTTGAQTINKTAGTVNLAAAAASLVVTNSLVTTNSIILCTVGTNDTTCKACQAVAASGSFTIYPNAVPTAETRVNFLVVN